MSNSVLFSVIIPTYNRAHMIMETLNTVFQQTYGNYEIIVVDNCSTDDTEAVLSELIRAGKINYIRHDRNYERSRSRNTGMLHARGDYATFLDSDDFLYPACLQDAADYIAANPDVKIFQNKYELVNNDRVPIYQFKFPSLRNQYKALAGGNFISCIGGFIHKDVYKHIHFNEEPKMIGAEDYEIWFEILARHKMGRIDKVNAGIREHPDRSVNLGVYNNIEFQRKYLIEKLKKDELLFNKFAPYLRKLEASFLLQQAIVSNQLKDKNKSLTLLKQAVAADFKTIFSLRYYKILYNTIKI